MTLGRFFCHCQNLPQNLGKYYISKPILELGAHCQSCHQDIRTSERSCRCGNLALIKIPKNWLLMSLDQSMFHTRNPSTNCTNWWLIKLLVTFTPVQCFVLFFNIHSEFQSPTINNLFFSGVNLRCPILKNSHNMGWGCVWSLSLERTYLSVFHDVADRLAIVG